MRYFQTDDIPPDEPKKDCIHTYYRIVVDGEIIKEGRHAVKQTKHIENRTIYKRRWNESKRCWKGEDWEVVEVEITPPPPDKQESVFRTLTKFEL